MYWVDWLQILQLLQGNLDNSLLKTLKLYWVAFHSVIFQLKCFEIYNLRRNSSLPVLSRFCNKLLDQKFRSFPATLLCASVFLFKTSPRKGDTYFYTKIRLETGAKDNPEIAYCTELT